ISRCFSASRSCNASRDSEETLHLLRIVFSPDHCLSPASASTSASIQPCACSIYSRSLAGALGESAGLSFSAVDGFDLSTVSTGLALSAVLLPASASVEVAGLADALPPACVPASEDCAVVETSSADFFADEFAASSAL